MEAIDAQREQVHGRGSWRTAEPGTRFTLLDHPVHDGSDTSRDEFIITRVVHRARSNVTADAKTRLGATDALARDTSAAATAPCPPGARENSGARRGQEFGTFLHSTNHRAYSDVVGERLQDIQRLKHAGKLDCKQAARKIRRMQRDLRAALKSNAPLMKSEGSTHAYWRDVI